MSFVSRPRTASGLASGESRSNRIAVTLGEYWTGDAAGRLRVQPGRSASAGRRRCPRSGRCGRSDRSYRPRNSVMDQADGQDLLTRAFLRQLEFVSPEIEDRMAFLIDDCGVDQHASRHRSDRGLPGLAVSKSGEAYGQDRGTDYAPCGASPRRLESRAARGTFMTPSRPWDSESIPVRRQVPTPTL